MRKIVRLGLVALLIFLMLVGIAGCGASASKTTSENGAKAEEKLKVGFVYSSTPGDVGWTYSHDQARLYMEEQLPYVETSYVENVSEGGGDSERVMEQMIKSGVKVIIASSFGYMDSVIKIAEKYPDVYFLHSNGFKTAANVSTYDVREYDATYLTGVVAGKMTKTGKIGYVASQPIPCVVRAIDGFALGVKSVNPDAVVQLVWTNTWYDPPKEKDAAMSLIDAGADVVAEYQNTPAVQQAAQERGVYSIGYHSDMRSFAPDANLTGFLWGWDKMFVEEVEKYHNGTWKGTALWPGMKDGAGTIVPINEKLVPADVIALVDETQAKLISGEVTVYAGPLKDNTGKEMVKAGAVATDEQLLSINWLVDNIKGVMPSSN